MKPYTLKKIICLIALFIVLILFSSVVTAQNATREEAVSAIEQAQEIKTELSLLNFSVQWYIDMINESLYTLQLADLSLQLQQNESLVDASTKLLLKAKQEEFSYDAVIEIVSSIKQRKDLTYSLFDELVILQRSLESYEELGVDVSVVSLQLSQARDAFNREQYAQAQDLLQKTANSLNQLEAKNTTVSLLLRSSKNYFQNNYKEAIIVFAVAALISFILIRHFSIKRLRRKVKNFKAEKRSLQRLEKKIQTQRFKNSAISQAVFLRKKEQYDKRLSELEEIIPTYEKRL